MSKLLEIRCAQSNDPSIRRSGGGALMELSRNQRAISLPPCFIGQASPPIPGRPLATFGIVASRSTPLYTEFRFRGTRRANVRPWPGPTARATGQVSMRSASGFVPGADRRGCNCVCGSRHLHKPGRPHPSNPIISLLQLSLAAGDRRRWNNQAERPGLR